MSVGSEGVKVASRKSAKNVLANALESDSAYKKQVTDQLDSWSKTMAFMNPSMGKVFKKAKEDVSKGKMTDSVYDAFNVMLVDHTDAGNAISSKFYETMRNAGYQAVRDVNDVKFSGYKSKNPLIVFDTSRVNVSDVAQVAERTIGENYTKERNSQMVSALAQTATSMGALSAAPAVITALVSRAGERRYVQNYMKEHPGTKKTRNEILRMYEREQAA